MKLSDLRRPLLERPVHLSQNRVFTVRALSAAQTIAVQEALPFPSPPMKADPTKGSLAPQVPDEKDPVFLAACAGVTRERTMAEVAIAIDLDLEEAAGKYVAWETAEEKKKWIGLAVKAMAEIFSEQEILTLWNTSMVLGGPEAVRQYIGQLVVKVEPKSATETALKAGEKDIPADYAYTAEALTLKVCERFGQNPSTWPATWTAEEQAKYLAFERIATHEEQMRDQIQAGLLTMMSGKR